MTKSNKETKNMLQKYFHVLTLAICFFAVENLKPSSAEALPTCLELRSACESPPNYAVTEWIYGPPPYCHVWESKGKDKKAFEKCVQEDSLYSCRQACIVSHGAGKCKDTCEFKRKKFK
jgi:hypothetical protein